MRWSAVSREQSSGEVERESLGWRLITHLPVPPKVKENPFIWFAIGTAHGAWLLTYLSIPSSYLIWASIGIAAAIQITGSLK